MQHCLALAARAVGISNPNPAVGCVIVSAAGEVLGEGHTQAVGGPHAEVMALRDAASKGHGVHGATAYVSLEPCAHHGRTPPCCDALIAAGIGKVVASLADPNPLVAGQGFARLRGAGIAVEVGDGAEQARELNIGFLQRMEHQRPWVRAKAAASLDGITALPNGQSQWITSAEARHDGQRWRARACAILTGIGTVLQDDPLLNVREPEGVALPRQPHLVIVDSRLRTPPSARLWSVPGRRVLVFGVAPPAHQEDEGLLQRQQMLQRRGAEVLLLPPAQAAQQGGAQRVDLQALLQHLLALPVNEIHVEAGATLNGALLAAGWIDEWLVYLAPCLLGTGRPIAALVPPLQNLQQAGRLHWHGVERIGPDLRLLARRG
ncbi:bifunctional diaminohydroxyphosphoribosylaminopyrimidine deaminase/5-amino-6-(5-phosphoribosylamino)uracil reductase RibD [Corticibacter populi]|uniref:Riboflavin biosynthesis protein RibD n=2 Tax=Corticibacter populi TaxID=1550736 RepID=A0A3M6QNX9_9BURK|nr:bifunctional diaminohydroxyphosphoribosylaminopyrimidine deaminase/5-amino-6-(5-phosphoribosylamino)uracil reductase RibD [Corticibacter populi]